MSSVTLGSEGFHPDRKDLKDERFKQTTQEINNKMPTYNSKNGGKATVLLGDFKPDYRNRDQIMLEEREKLKSPRGKKCEFSKQVSA